MTASDRKVNGWIEDIVGALFDPIIVMPGGWGDDLPEWLRTRVTVGNQQNGTLFEPNTFG